MASNPTTAAQKTRYHAFLEQAHHPFVQAMSHVISPLTASLFIFGVHKVAQAPAFRASARAAYILWRANLHRRSQHWSWFKHSSVFRYHPPSGVHHTPHTHAHAREMATTVSATGVHPHAHGVPLHHYSTVTDAATAAATAAIEQQIEQVAMAEVTSESATTTVTDAGATDSAASSSTSTAPTSSTSISNVATTAATIAAAGSIMSSLPADALPGSLDPMMGSSMTDLDMSTDGVAIDSTPAIPLPDHPMVQLLEDGRVIVPPELLQQLQTIYEVEDACKVADHVYPIWSVMQVQSFLNYIHDVTHWPWWATIAFATVVLRAAISFIQINMLRNSTRMKVIQPEVDRIHQAMLTAHSETAAVKAANELKALYRTNQCSPWKQFLAVPVVLPPLILSIFGAIHNLCLVEPTMATEGLWWFPDLISVDSTNLLPILSALTWLWNVELGAGVYYHAWSAPKSVARMVSVASIPLTANLPSGVFVFWVTSNLFAIARTYVTRSDRIRRWLNIPLVSEIAALKHLPKPGSHH